MSIRTAIIEAEPSPATDNRWVIRHSAIPGTPTRLYLKPKDKGAPPVGTPAGTLGTIEWYPGEPLRDPLQPTDYYQWRTS